MFKLNIKTENDSFQDENKAYEIARILRACAEAVQHGAESGAVRDSNGNKCGQWTIE